MKFCSQETWTISSLSIRQSQLKLCISSLRSCGLEKDAEPIQDTSKEAATLVLWMYVRLWSDHFSLLNKRAPCCKQCDHKAWTISAKSTDLQLLLWNVSSGVKDVQFHSVVYDNASTLKLLLKAYLKHFWAKIVSALYALLWSYDGISHEYDAAMCIPVNSVFKLFTPPENLLGQNCL